jgi:hypothetical protein
MFDLVIEPGEVAAEADRGATRLLEDATRVGPVTLLEQVTPDSRRDAAARLGLDPQRPAALVTLRTDSMTDQTAAAAAVRAVLRDPRWQVALTRTPLTEGDLGDDSDRVVMLRGVFPLAARLAAFDAAVTEAGYNSFHEVLHAGLPSLVVPTGAAVTDDQAARARWAAEQGLALTAPEDDPAQVADAAAELLLPETRRKLADRCGRLARPQGASEAADLLCELAKGFGTHRFSPAERARVARLRLRPAVDRVMGMARREPAAGKPRGEERLTPATRRRLRILVEEGVRAQERLVPPCPPVAGRCVRGHGRDLLRPRRAQHHDSQGRGQEGEATQGQRRSEQGPQRQLSRTHTQIKRLPLREPLSVSSPPAPP